MSSLRNIALLSTAITALCSLSITFAAAADVYPSRPVRVVLGFPPGGGSDAVARLITPKLHEALGQPWVVDNRGGAAGNISTEIVAHANADGYTTLLGFSTTLTVNPTLYKLPINVATDLQPVINLVTGQYMLVLHPSIKAETLKDFIAIAKSRDRALNYASSGIGSPHHLAAELFKSRTGANLVHVPYKGGGPAAAAVVGGEVELLFGSLPSVLPQVKAGRLKAIAVTSLKRAAAAPNVPTLAESGLAGFDVTSWYGLLVPAHTPERIVTVLYHAASKALQQPDVQEGFSRQGLELSGAGPVPFAAQIKAETALWAKLIKASGIRAE